MKRESGAVKISNGDDKHPRILLKELKQKKKILEKAMKGNYSGMSAEEAETYRKMSPESMQKMLGTYSDRIKSIKAGFWNQGKVASDNERERRRASWTSYRNSGLFVRPSMNPIKRTEKVMDQKKKESEDL